MTDTITLTDPEYTDVGPEADEAASKKAEARGCKTIIGDDMHLLLDFDNKEAWRTYQRRIETLKGYVKTQEEQFWMSSSRQPWHIHAYITLVQPMKVGERLLVQMFLGSDVARCSLDFERLLRGVVEPSRLFQPQPPEEPDYEGWTDKDYQLEHNDDFPF